MGGGAFHTAICQILFTKGSLADNSPNFPTTKVSLHTVQEIWLTKTDFGQLNTKIGQKMANGRLLFLALRSQQDCLQVTQEKSCVWSSMQILF